MTAARSRSVTAQSPVASAGGGGGIKLFPFSLLTRIEGRKQGNRLDQGHRRWGDSSREGALGCYTQAPPRSAVCSKNQGLQNRVREGLGSGSSSDRKALPPTTSWSKGLSLPGLSFLIYEMEKLMAATLQACHEGSVR